MRGGRAAPVREWIAGDAPRPRSASSIPARPTGSCVRRPRAWVQSAEAGAPTYVVPAGRWVIVSWSHRANSASGRELGVRVWRATATPGSYTLVGAGVLRTLDTWRDQHSLRAHHGLRRGHPRPAGRKPAGFPVRRRRVLCFTAGVGDSDPLRDRGKRAASRFDERPFSAHAGIPAERDRAPRGRRGLGRLRRRDPGHVPRDRGVGVGLHAGGPCRRRRTPPGRPRSWTPAAIDPRRPRCRLGHSQRGGHGHSDGNAQHRLPSEHAPAADRDRESRWRSKRERMLLRLSRKTRAPPAGPCGRGKRLRVRVSVTLRDAAGNTGTAKRSVHLEALIASPAGASCRPIPSLSCRVSGCQESRTATPGVRCTAGALLLGFPRSTRVPRPRSVSSTPARPAAVARLSPAGSRTPRGWEPRTSCPGGRG